MSSLRWTEEQVEQYRKRQEPRILIDEPIVVVAQPEKVSKIERRFGQQLDEAGLPPYVRNFFSIPDRDFEIDYCWPSRKLGFDVDGMVHRIKGRFERDVERHNLHVLYGWTVFRVSGKMVRSGEAIALAKKVLADGWQMGSGLGPQQEYGRKRDGA